MDPIENEMVHLKGISVTIKISNAVCWHIDSINGHLVTSTASALSDTKLKPSFMWKGSWASIKVHIDQRKLGVANCLGTAGIVEIPHSASANDMLFWITLLRNSCTASKARNQCMGPPRLRVGVMTDKWGSFYAQHIREVAAQPACYTDLLRKRKYLNIYIYINPSFSL